MGDGKIYMETRGWNADLSVVMGPEKGERSVQINQLSIRAHNEWPADGYEVPVIFAFMKFRLTLHLTKARYKPGSGDCVGEQGLAFESEASSEHTSGAEWSASTASLSGRATKGEKTSITLKAPQYTIDFGSDDLSMPFWEIYRKGEVLRVSLTNRLLAVVEPDRVSDFRISYSATIRPNHVAVLDSPLRPKNKGSISGALAQHILRIALISRSDSKIKTRVAQHASTETPEEVPHE